ncbi:TraB/GumN family protein [Ochrobactrum soli]|uniref:Polysaccharide biosynthesis protein GumN n=1 Tax=Ochrobactrum soli TaxID=2448455 RepID=A0A849KD19_9HYPH|nr:TraB/GumN family protein [[Ochrobactrum] soli]NNU59321.1 polysaccharide biosynthesis protein GumN [[Ochrobactrum] soli]
MKKLLLVLLCAVFAGSVTARADEKATACSVRGENLVDGVEKSDPALWKKLQAEAEATPNHQGRLWKIEKDGIAPSYLFGTIHLSDPRVLDLPKPVEDAYRSTGTVVIETTDVLDQKNFLRLKLERPELLLFTDGSTLKSHLPADRRDDIEKKLAERGIILDAVAKMKPWVLTTLLSLPECERERKSEGEKSLDEFLAVNAKAEGREIAGLETAAEQFEATEKLPLDFHIRNLIATVDYGDKSEDAMETTTALYLKGELGMIMPALRQIVPDALSDQDYDLFQKYLITDRNHTMADRAVPLLEKGNVFIAIGALHLPGQEGVVELLRAKGYRLTAL